MLKVASCICLCVRPVELPGCLSFVFLIELVNSAVLREKLTCYILVKEKVMCLDDHLLINFFCGVNSTSYSMHQGLCCYCFWLCTLPGSLWGYCVGIFFTVGQLCSGQITASPLPHHPKIHHRDYIERILLNAKTE